MDLQLSCTPNTSNFWHKVHVSPNLIGPNWVEARGRWRLVIPWQKGGDGSW